MKCIVSLLMMVILVGCGGMPGAYSARATSLEGVVYTGGGAPLRDARIALNEGPSVWSDTNGRFTIPRVRPGEHRLRAHHATHEAVELTITFSRPTDILYLRLLSIGDLVRASQHALDRGRPSEAQELIARALAVSPDSVRARYFAAIIHAAAGRSDEALRILDRLDSALPAVVLLRERLSQEESK